MSSSPKKKTIRRYFIISPIVFFILSYLLIFIAAYPIASTISSSVNMLFLTEKIDLSNQAKDIITESSMPSQGTINADDIEFPSYGDIFGKISIENTTVNANIYFGDGDEQLKSGVGIYNGSSVPGYGRTILMAGHNNTYFNGLKDVSNGDIIDIKTNYGEYKYRITDAKVLNYDDKTAFDLSKNEENLVMYTCYPFDTLGFTKQRYFVYAELVSGPSIVYNK